MPKILESIVTTVSQTGAPHIAPMGVWWDNDQLVLAPFKPSTTLDNLRNTGVAVVNFCDDVRVFAGCLSGRRDWPLQQTDSIECVRLSSGIRHLELQIANEIDDELRPKCHCDVVADQSHGTFKGFNRAQFSVIELAILVSRLQMLPAEKIRSEIDYLKIGFTKTAGPGELEAWSWLMEKVDAHQYADEHLPD